jgi:hypothetical protein
LTGGNRVTLAAWTIAAVAGTLGVWWLSRYLETLVALAETDRDGAIVLFRSRALPALLAIVGIAAAAGAILMRQGLQLVSDANRSTGRSRDRGSARLLGWMLAVAGFVMAAVPLGMTAMVFWLLRGA